MAQIQEVHTRPRAVMYPNIVDPKDGRDWAIEEDGIAPRMSFEAGKFWVPTDDTEDSIAVRAHEQAHLWLTPEDAYERPALAKVPNDLINACEDGRINSRLEQVGVKTWDYSGSPLYDESRVIDQMKQHPMTAAFLRCCAEGTPWKARAQEIVESLWPGEAEWIDRTATRLSTPGAEFEVTEQVAIAVYEHYMEDKDDEDEGEGEGGGQPGEGEESQSSGGQSSNESSGGASGGDDTDGDTDGDEEDGDGSDGDEEENTPPPPKRPRTPRPAKPKPSDLELDDAPWKPKKGSKSSSKKEAELGEVEVEIKINGIDEGAAVRAGLVRLDNPRIAYRSSPSTPWCYMEERFPPLTEDIDRKPRAGRRGEVYGRVPRYPHRMVTDLRVFTRKAKGIKYPGTVLVDVSGSMSLTGDDIAEVAEGYPNAEMRDYCANSSRGILRVIAKKGKRLSNEELDSRIGGNNGIDGPALRWLATQPRPRFWISDGLVVGSQDTGGWALAQELLDECKEICARYRIIRVEDIPTFLKHYR